MGNVSWEDEQIMILAKLNGNWDQVGFRFSLACEFRCLEILIDDDNSMIKNIAIRHLMSQSNQSLDIIEENEL